MALDKNKIVWVHRKRTSIAPFFPKKQDELIGMKVKEENAQ